MWGTIVSFILTTPHMRKVIFGVGITLGLGLMYVHAYMEGKRAAGAEYELAQQKAKVASLQADLETARRAAEADTLLQKEQQEVAGKADKQAEEVIRYVVKNKTVHSYGLRSGTADRVRAYLRATEEALAGHPR